MEYYWSTLFNHSSTTSTNTTSTTTSNNNTNNVARGYNHACEAANPSIWDFNYGSSSSSSYPLHHSSLTNNYSTDQGLIMLQEQQQQERVDATSCYFKPDPHVMCLKLGKRPYFENHVMGEMGGLESSNYSCMANRKGKLPYNAAAAAVARCQVEGCGVALVDAKEYHRRHRVCEMHAKAPKVVVLGMKQRFCQQCSRFHGIGEFDESKRSCRRRLAGHNERRRKSSSCSSHQDHNNIHHSSSLAASRKRPNSHQGDTKMMFAGRNHPHFLMNSSECALSLLSSTNNNNIPSCWNITAQSEDLSARCSAALDELIAENRAYSSLGYRQQFNPSYQQLMGSTRAVSDPRLLNPQEDGSHVTLDLMQDPNSAFGLLSMHECKSSKEGDHGGDCSEMWKFPLGY